MQMDREFPLIRRSFCIGSRPEFRAKLHPPLPHSSLGLFRPLNLDSEALAGTPWRRNRRKALVKVTN